MGTFVAGQARPPVRAHPRAGVGVAFALSFQRRRGPRTQRRFAGCSKSVLYIPIISTTLKSLRLAPSAGSLAIP